MPSKNKKPSNRLTGTLLLLMLSMTAGFGVLNWLHDLSADTGASPRALRADGAGREGAAWTRIVIHSVGRDTQTLPFHHFYIDDRGQEQFSPAWGRGQQDAERSRTIHVALARNARSGGITRRQWETLVARLRTLQARHGLRARNIALDTADDGLDAPTRDELEQLHRMLQTAGLSG